MCAGITKTLPKNKTCQILGLCKKLRAPYSEEYHQCPMVWGFQPLENLTKRQENGQRKTNLMVFQQGVFMRFGPFGIILAIGLSVFRTLSSLLISRSPNCLLLHSCEEGRVEVDPKPQKRSKKNEVGCWIWEPWNARFKCPLHRNLSTFCKVPYLSYEISFNHGLCATTLSALTCQRTTQYWPKIGLKTMQCALGTTSCASEKILTCM